MLSTWYLVVRGDEPDLARLGELCASSTEYSLAQEQPGEWRLRSSTIGPAIVHEDAWPMLCELLVRLSDVAAAAAYTRVRLTTWLLGRTRPDGRSDVFVHPDAAHIRARGIPPTNSVGGTPTEPVQARLLRLQETDDHLRLALHFLNADLSWFNLWKAFDAIRAANHGWQTLVANGWTQKTELDRFRKTANTYSAVGDAARHALIGVTAPPNPVTQEDADEFVRGLLFRWVASHS